MASCETCQYALIDEVTGEAQCDLDLDEDELARLAWHTTKECPFYKDGDEYKTVRHQMQKGKTCLQNMRKKHTFIAHWGARYWYHIPIAKI